MGFFDLGQAAGAVLCRKAPGIDRLADEGAIGIAVRRGNGPPDRFLARLTFSSAIVITSSTIPGSSSPVFEPAICGWNTLRLKSSSFSSRISDEPDVLRPRVLESKRGLRPIAF